MTISPESLDIIKEIVAGLVLVFGGGGIGHKICSRRNFKPWEKDKDGDRRDKVHEHNGNGNGKIKEENIPTEKLVFKDVCELKHQLVKQSLDNIVTSTNEIKKDIKEIVKKLP